MVLYQSPLTTPVGELSLIANTHQLLAVLWSSDTPKRVALAAMPQQRSFQHDILLQAAAELTEYFQGSRTHFTVPYGCLGTAFQQQVWHALAHIPYASLSNYAYIAKQLHQPQAARAIGNAVGKNPLSIIVPCHRVVGSTGRLTGFAGGLDNKQWLLQWEQNRAQQQPPSHAK